MLIGGALETKSPTSRKKREIWGTLDYQSADVGHPPVQRSAFVVPALRKEREGRGTHFLGDISEIKKLGHPAEMVLNRFM